MEEREPKLEDFEKYLNTIKKFFKQQNDVIINDYFHFTHKKEDFKLVLTDNYTLSIKKAIPYYDEKNTYYGTLEFKKHKYQDEDGESKTNISIYFKSDYFEWLSTLITNVKDDYVKEIINIPNPIELQKLAEKQFDESITDILRNEMSKQEIKFWKMGFLNGFLKDK